MDSTYTVHIILKGFLFLQREDQRIIRHVLEKIISQKSTHPWFIKTNLVQREEI